ncbi:hypothetical protein B0H10DRAFT_2011542 [Mycena sp. CBHHK59/15]|nr:hypothetical protein B0H10DRAFT_2011542 [Mycena sp. CBHHK59/15]
MHRLPRRQNTLQRDPPVPGRSSLSFLLASLTGRAQNCLKRGLASVCTYDETDNRGLDDNTVAAEATAATPFVAPPVYATHVGGMTLNHQQYYDYNGTFTGASSSTFRPAKRPRALTDEETAAITRNFTRGDFFVGNSAPVRIDPRLPVRLTLGEGDHVHFNVGNYDTQS